MKSWEALEINSGPGSSPRLRNTVTSADPPPHPSAGAERPERARRVPGGGREGQGGGPKTKLLNESVFL